jgi:hypothetical protein
MGGRTGYSALALSLSLLFLLPRCTDNRAPTGAVCNAGTQCQTGLCLERPAGGAVCVSRCAVDADCPAAEVCGRFDFRGRDDSGVPVGKDSDVVRVCRRPLQARCADTCAPGERCVGEADAVCAPACRDRVDCGGRDCVPDGCGPGHCAPACDSLRDCPRFNVCDSAFVGTDGHGRCLAVASGATDAGVGTDATCVDAP